MSDAWPMSAMKPTAAATESGMPDDGQSPTTPPTSANGTLTSDEQREAQTAERVEQQHRT